MNRKLKSVQLSPEDLASVRRGAKRAVKHFSELAAIAQTQLGLPAIPVGLETTTEILFRPYNSKTVIKIYDTRTRRLLSSIVHEDPPGICRPPRSDE